jgi:16S rRNA (guanine966-N2)-methyltransferase
MKSRNANQRNSRPKKNADHPQKGIKGGAGVVRIIGGDWRGRKLSFSSAQGLRPTGDRVRETLFNWLMYDIAGKNILDAFAGSGALGLEALSRSARYTTFIEKHTPAADNIRANLTTFQCDNAKVMNSDALTVLSNKAERAFDVVFLDPPFHKDLLQPSLEALQQHGWLADGAILYIEAERDLIMDISPLFSIRKHQQTGMVQSWLLDYRPI